MGTAELIQLDDGIARLKNGDESARSELIELVNQRLLRLTRAMLRGFPRVHRWEETDDVWQNALFRLWKSLEKVQPEDSRHFLRLAAVQIRRELIELARHYHGPRGMGTHHATPPDTPATAEPTNPAAEPTDATHEATRLAVWTELHECVEAMPDTEREVFELVWYHGLKQAEAAAVLNVSQRTLKRRWQAARLLLADQLNHELPT